MPFFLKSSQKCCACLVSVVPSNTKSLLVAKVVVFQKSNGRFFLLIFVVVGLLGGCGMVGDTSVPMLFTRV